MKKLLAFFAFLSAILLLPACSHNVVTYSDGVGVETTFRPDNGNFGMTVRYGKIFSFVARENSEAEMSGTNTIKTPVSGTGTTALENTTDGAVKVKIGPQTTGYEADIIAALKDNPESVKAFYAGKVATMQASKLSESSSSDSAVAK